MQKFAGISRSVLRLIAAVESGEEETKIETENHRRGKGILLERNLSLRKLIKGSHCIDTSGDV